jgi:hypothetical protein
MSTDSLMAIAVIVILGILALVMAILYYAQELADQRRVTEFYRTRLRLRADEVLRLEAALRLANDLDGDVTSIDAAELERILHSHMPADRYKREALLDLRDLARAPQSNTDRLMAYNRSSS